MNSRAGFLLEEVLQTGWQKGWQNGGGGILSRVGSPTGIFVSKIGHSSDIFLKTRNSCAASLFRSLSGGRLCALDTAVLYRQSPEVTMRGEYGELQVASHLQTERAESEKPAIFYVIPVSS